MFGLGPWELAILALIVLLVFGNRLPSVMRSLGQGVVEFKKGLQDVQSDIKSSGQIENQPSKSEPREEAKTRETETVER